MTKFFLTFAVPIIMTAITVALAYNIGLDQGAKDMQAQMMKESERKLGQLAPVIHADAAVVLIPVQKFDDVIRTLNTAYDQMECQQKTRDDFWFLGEARDRVLKTRQYLQTVEEK